jgi:apolipoprotein N-acyltransferase
MTWLAETMMLSHGWRRFLILVVAGAIAATSAPPLFFLPALFLALPVWIWALDGAERKRTLLGRIFGPAFSIGFAFGLGYFCAALHWFGAAFLQQGGIFLVLMPFAIAGAAAVVAIFWGLASSLAHLLWSEGWFRIVTFTACLALGEWARGHLFTGLPYDILGYALTGNDQLMQFASIGGVYGLTLLVILLATTPALIWPADRRGWALRALPFTLAMAALALQVGYGYWRLNNVAVVARTDIKVRMVQPMVLDHADWSQGDPAQIIGQLIDLSAQKLTPDAPGLDGVTAVVWPESVFPFFLSSYPDALARIARMLPDNTTLLTGAPREPIGDDGNPIPDNPGFNSILAINTDGEVVASYDKSHLVPVGEYLPFQDFWRLFGINQFVPGTNGWAPGDRKRLMQVPGLPAFLALICYEAAFSGDIGNPAEAEFILNVTNDAWFDGSVGPALFANHARLRSVETGLPMLRAANTGETFATDPLGRITASLAPGQPGVLDVAPTQKLVGGTLFGRFGDWPFLALIALGLAMSVVLLRRPRRLE